MKTQIRSSLLPCCALLLVALLVLTASAMQNGSGQGGENTGWQHLALSHDGTNFDQKLSQQINRLGNEGWQLVCVTSVEGDGTTVKMVYFFKREK